MNKYRIRNCYRVKFTAIRRLEYVSDEEITHNIRWVTDTMHPLELFEELGDKYLPDNETMDKIIRLRLIGDVCVPYSEVWDG